ncbi:MAG: hypothetical protein JXA94_06965 [Parachlamydiales bacterium]|nr:hypothetical protein [Parachlamydiales bacterium]
MAARAGSSQRLTQSLGAMEFGRSRLYSARDERLFRSDTNLTSLAAPIDPKTINFREYLYYLNHRLDKAARQTLFNLKEYTQDDLKLPIYCTTPFLAELSPIQITRSGWGVDQAKHGFLVLVLTRAHVNEKKKLIKTATHVELIYNMNANPKQSPRFRGLDKVTKIISLIGGKIYERSSVILEKGNLTTNSIVILNKLLAGELVRSINQNATFILET